MATIVAERPMGKKRADGGKDAGQPAPAGPDKTTTKVRPELMRKAKTVASFRDMDLFDYLDQILTEAVERDYNRVAKEIAAEGGK